MKKIILLLLLGTLLVPTQLFSQKTGQDELNNEFYAGYGAGSIYYFTNNIHHKDYPDYYHDYYNYYYNEYESDPQSAGAFFLGYQRKINKVISVGFQFAFMNLHHTAQYYNSDLDSTVGPYKFTDNLLSGISKINFTYLQLPILQMYSGISIGISVDFGSAEIEGTKYTDKKLYPAGQITLMGLRVGRAFGGFAEFGFGSNGIINVGLNYKFGKE
jgi:hypothetical protein